MKKIDVKDKVVIVTGASGFIGRSLSWEFAKCGAKVVLADIGDERGEQTAEQIRAEGYEAIYVHFDQTDMSCIESAFKQVFEKYGSIDVLINNAGVNIPQDCRRKITDFMDDKFEWMIDVDMHGLIRCCKAVLPYML